MKVGILGSGMVGQSLARGFAGLGYDVKVGTRDISKLEKWQKELNSPKVSLGSFAEAASFGEALVLATHGVTTLAAIDMAGKEKFGGKMVIDATNPLDFSKGVPPRFAAELGNSLGEQIQRFIPQAKLVKAFNTVNALTMINAHLEEGRPDLFIAGNDDSAKKWVEELAQKWGWNSCVDIGGIAESFWLEAFAMLWIIYGFKNNNWTHAFKLLKK
ncbi:MAG: NAD(P)-binding domain-containing protein [Candidatus Zixiibacteriota bacterium]|jgi:predicted dinucleotide-binding enzyme